MKLAASIALLSFASVLAYAEGPKPCEELKSEIQKKLEDHGAKNFTLEILANAKVGEGKVVGSCEAGTKKIVYSKPAATAPAPKAPAPAKKP